MLIIDGLCQPRRKPTIHALGAAKLWLLSKICETSEDDFGPWIVRQAATLVDLELEVLRIAIAPGLHA